LPWNRAAWWCAAPATRSVNERRSAPSGDLRARSCISVRTESGAVRRLR
jgi:hypothetical protein